MTELPHIHRVALAETDVDAGLRRHDVYASRAGYPLTVIPAQPPHAAASTTVIPAQAGIHASLHFKWLGPRDPRRLHARNTTVRFGATNVDAGLRRHDELDGYRTRILSTVIPARAPHVDAPEVVTAARVTQPTRDAVIPAQTPHAAAPTTVIPAQPPHVAARATVIPAQAGIHASFHTRTLEILDEPHQATRPA